MQSETANVEFYSPGANQPSIGTLAVPTVVDPMAIAGSITITFADDTSPTDYEKSVNTNEQSASVTLQ